MLLRRVALIQGFHKVIAVQMVVPTASHGSTLVHLCFHRNWNASRIESKAVYPNIFWPCFVSFRSFIESSQSQPVQVHCWNGPRIPRCLSQNLSGKAKTMDSAMASPWGRRKMLKKVTSKDKEASNFFVTSWNYGRFPVQIFSPNKSTKIHSLILLGQWRLESNLNFAPGWWTQSIEQQEGDSSETSNRLCLHSANDRCHPFRSEVRNTNAICYGSCRSKTWRNKKIYICILWLSAFDTVAVASSLKHRCATVIHIFVKWVTAMWSTRLWLVKILTLVYRLTCKSSCKCFAALYLSSAHARMLGMWSILHRDKNSHTWVTPKHTFLSKPNGTECHCFWQVISCFLGNFPLSFSPNWASAWPHGEEHCTKHSSGHENSSTNLAFLHGSCEMLKFHHLPDVRYHWIMGGKWLDVKTSQLFLQICMECITKWLVGFSTRSDDWSPEILDGTGTTLTVSLRNLKQRCQVSSAEMLVPFGSWISDQPRTWIIDYVTIINPQRNVERWICRHASGSKTSMGDIVLLGREGGRWKGDFSFMFLFRNTSDWNICYMSHIVWDSNAFLN